MAVVLIVALLLPNRPFSFVPVTEGQENNDKTLLHTPLTPDQGGPVGEGCSHTAPPGLLLEVLESVPLGSWFPRRECGLTALGWHWGHVRDQGCIWGWMSNPDNVARGCAVSIWSSTVQAKPVLGHRTWGRL